MGSHKCRRSSEGIRASRAPGWREEELGLSSEKRVRFRQKKKKRRRRGHSRRWRSVNKGMEVLGVVCRLFLRVREGRRDGTRESGKGV